MANIIFTLMFMTVLVGFAAVLWWYIYPQQKPTVEYTRDMTTWNFSYRDFHQTAAFDRSCLDVASQSLEWRRQMNSCGQILANAHVKGIILVHGTFVGNDPMGLVEILKTVYPTIEKKIAARIRRVLKRNSELLIADNGNYTTTYAQILQEAMGAKVPCRLFDWSSGNHHFARLMGAVKLAKELADEVLSRRLLAQDRLLVWGHSHAGQVFALLAQLLEYEQTGYRLLEILQDASVDIVKLNSSLQTLRQITIDFVTFGSPILYSWPDSGYYRLLHIVNHRGQSHLAGSLRGILHTRDGDYIQQLGILGTDMIATTPKERRLNQKLDQIFGSGRDIKSWRKYLSQRMRVSPFGKTFLINYMDHSPLIPNFYRTMFGHGIYTRYETMLFNLRLVTEYLYKQNPR